jgi:hypothetical protein
LFPAADLLDDGIGVSGPEERFGIVVGLPHEAVDGGLEIGDAFEHAALEPTPRQLGEETLDRIEPGGRGRGEMEMEALVSPQPGVNLGMACVWRNCRRSDAARTQLGFRG